MTLPYVTLEGTTVKIDLFDQMTYYPLHEWNLYRGGPNGRFDCV